MRRRPASTVAKGWISLAATTPTVLDPRRRGQWVRRAARYSGRIAGSARRRVVYL
jgi:hypothetical protein